MGWRRAEGRQSRPKKLFLGCREEFEACRSGLGLVRRGPRGSDRGEAQRVGSHSLCNAGNEYRCHSQISGDSGDSLRR